MTTAPGARTILYIHPSDELYGADRCLLELVRRLPATTRAVVALPTDIDYAGTLSRELVACGAEIRQVDFAVLRRASLRPAHWPRLLWRSTVGSAQLARLAREIDADIVHSNTLAAISGPIAALLARRPHVWQVHEVIADEPWAVRLAYRTALLLPGRLIANSIATAQAMAGPLRTIRWKTTVIYPGVTSFQAPAPVRAIAAANVLRIAFVGRLAPRKGVEELLQAMAILRSRGIAIELDVFGSAPPGQAWRTGQYRRRAVGLGLGDLVRFVGFVNDIPRRLTDVDLLVVPSQRPEPFGLVLLDGMLARCAVLACRNGGGSDEIIQHGVTGCYCGRTASSIAAAIERLAHDPALCQRLGRQAQTTVRERFALERYLDDVFGLYRKMLDTNHLLSPE